MVYFKNAVHNTVDVPFLNPNFVAHYSFNYHSVYKEQYYQTSYKICFPKR